MSVLVGKKAPDFKANAVVGGKIESGFTLSQFIGKKYVILFFLSQRLHLCVSNRNTRLSGGEKRI